jgi:lambda repressor-like predicted transcriptional regulator
MKIVHNALTRCPIVAITRRMSKFDGAMLEQRFKKLLGGYGSTARLARALQRHQSHLHRIWAGKNPPPPDLIAIAELLESLPEEKWPERWRRA